MFRFLQIFLLFIVCYHVFVTILGYGILWWEHIEQLLALKELIRGVAVLAFGASQREATKKYFQQRKKTWILFGIMIIFGVLMSRLQGQSRHSILIGLKYNFHFLGIFLSANWIWSIFFHQKKLKFWQKFTKNIHKRQYALIMIVFVGLIRQAFKMTNPERFSKLGYGPIGDFVFGTNPPLYYRTWPGGSTRRQWLFAGPNNYGYFLIAFFPLILLRRKNKLKHRKEIFLLSPEKLLNTFLLVFWIAAIVLTLSRAAFVGAIITIIISQKHLFKKIKRLKRATLSIVIAGLTGLSIWKRGSTQEHIQKTFSGIQQVIDHPTGQWLGTAWPAIHHGWSVLPENYYLQVMTDTGTLGFILWALVIFQLIQFSGFIHKQFKNKKNSGENELIFLHRKQLEVWRSVLLIMGLFLHVFEDSMVNYLFFVNFGLLTGYLSALTNQSPKYFSTEVVKRG